MGGLVIETIREGVQFTPLAAAAFRRAEASWGSEIDVNSTFRDPVKQDSMYEAWLRYVNSGYAPALYPGHSRALPSWQSIHCRGEALDTDDWVKPGFIAHMAEHGFIRTADWDPTEQHHFEYLKDRDKHFGEAIPVPSKPEENRDTNMPITLRREKNGQAILIEPGRFIKHVPNAEEEKLIRYAQGGDFKRVSDADLGDLMWAYGFPELKGDPDRLPYVGSARSPLGYYWSPGPNGRGNYS
jgi:hypothetical protein